MSVPGSTELALTSEGQIYARKCVELASQVRGVMLMAWRIKIHPKECDRLNVTLNGRSAFDWTAAQGHVEWPFPDWCRDLSAVEMVCTPFPDGRNASIALWWDNDLKYEKVFDSVDKRKLENDLYVQLNSIVFSLKSSQIERLVAFGREMQTK